MKSVLYGINPSILSFIVLLLTASLISCKKEDLIESNLSIDPSEGVAIANRSGFYACSIVHGDDQKNAMGLVDIIEKEFGTRLPVYHYGINEVRQEILIGDVGRKESQYLKSSLSGEGYIIKVVNRKLVIVGSDETWTAIALYDFQEKVLNNSDYIINGTLVIPLSFIMKNETRDSQLLAYLLANDYDFSLSMDYVFTCPNDGKLNIGQGATGDGSYYYFALKNTDDSAAKIIKYSISNLKEVGKTGTFDGGHANDLTYNSATNSLLLAHGHAQGNILTVVSCKDMNVIKDIQIPVGAGAITFNSKRKYYAVSQGGTSLHFLDESFNLMESFIREPVTGYTAQGMGSDDSYIYFPMSGKNDNIIVVYDWDGVYITTLTLNTPSESESFFYAAGNYYISFASTATSLYVIKPILHYHG